MRRPASAASSATSSPWERGRSLCSTGSGSALPTGTSVARSAGSRSTGTASGCRPSGGTTVFDDAYAANPLVNAMCVGLLPSGTRASGEGDGPGEPDRPLRRAHRARRDRRRLGAREPGSRGLRREAALGADRRPVPRQGADRGVPRPGRAGARRRAAGLRCRRARVLARRDGVGRRRGRRPPRPSAAARARSRALGDHDLRVAGADGRRRRAGTARRSPCRMRALGASLHGDRRGDGPRRAPCALRGRGRRGDPRRAPHRGDAALRPGNGAARGAGFSRAPR